jgi:4-hydroxybenzoate polyprenyltransferase
VSVAIYLFNGVTDIAGDQANGSKRPIASGRLPVTLAAQSTALLATGGLALCALVSPLLAGLALALLVLGWAYSAGPALKNATGGCALAVGGGAVLAYAAGGVIGGGLSAQSVSFAAAFALWVGLCSATKDLSDVEGDRLAGRRTWPVLYGDAGARRLISATSGLLTVGLALLCARLHGVLDVAAFTACLGAAALAIGVLLPATASTRTGGRRPYRVFMTVQYAVNATMIVGAVV